MTRRTPFPPGITIEGSNNQVLGNTIGLDGSRTTALPNLGDGIFIGSGQNNVIGGPIPDPANPAINPSANFISGNGDPLHAGNGVHVSTANSRFNNIAGNTIGLNSAGNAKKNFGDGVLIDAGAFRTTVGGATKAHANVISGNGGKGIESTGGNRTIIQYNTDGKNKVGLAVPNQGGGIFLADSNSLTEYNDIENNLGPGIVVVSGTGNIILSNTIAANTGIGIDLGNDGVTANDLGDGDSGPNDLQNFPVLISAVVAANSTTISGTLNSTPNTSFYIEFFGNNVASSSSAQGEFLLGSTPVMTDANGNATFSVTLPVAYGDFVSATATSSTMNTSEFSAATAVTSGSSGGTIQGRAWQDANSDGIQQTSEIPVAGVLVRLLNSNNTLIRSTVTDSNGNYSFTSVPAGTYFVAFQLPPSGYSYFSPEDQGNDDTVDSDISTTGLTAYFMLLSNGLMAHLDAGLVPSM